MTSSDRQRPPPPFALASVVVWVRELGLAIAVAIFIVAFQLNIQDMGLESRAYPQLVMAMLSIAVLVTIIQGVKKLLVTGDGHQEPLPSRSTWLPVVATAVGTALYIFTAIPALGFYTATVLFIAVLVLLLGLRSLVWAVVFAVGITAACYVLFSTFLSVLLPRGLIL